MGVDFTNIQSCRQITAEDAERAASSSDAMRALLKRAGEIVRPGEGCEALMSVVARMAGQPWFDGDLRVEFVDEEDVTALHVFAEQGVGIRERLMPVTRLPVRLDEFLGAVHASPTIAHPLGRMEQRGKLVLTTLIPADEPVENALGGSAPTAPGADVHRCPTVRRMVAIVPEALRSPDDP